MNKNFISCMLLLACICLGNILFTSHAQAQPGTQPAPRQLENLGPSVNSEYDEAYPIVSADGKTMFFIRVNSPQNVGGLPPEGKVNQDIWFSKMNADGSWAPAENFTQLNSDRSEFVSSVTPDGNVLLMGNKISYRTKKGWTDPAELSIANFYNRERKGRSNFFLTHDGQVLLMALEREDSKGLLDIYASFIQSDGSWSAPLHTGPVLNSFGDDFTPFLAADGKTLYFTSDGHKGSIGGADIYRSKRLDNSWKNWSTPENLGPTINSKKDEAYFTIPACGDHSYMISTENSIGRNDLFRLPIPPNMKPEPVMLLTGTTVDIGTNEALDAKIQYKTAAGKLVGTAITNPATGDYTIVLPKGEKYKVYCIVPNYVTDQSLEVDLTNISECQVKTYTHKMKATPTIIAGKIVNAATNAPLPAKLVAKPSDGTADITATVSASGEYKFELPGTSKGCTFMVEATGFVSVKEGYEVPADKLHTEVRKDFALKASAIGLTGRVLNSKTKQPIGVTATLSYKSSSNTDVKSIEVPISGDFKIDIPAEAASYELNVTAVGFHPVTDKFNVTPDQGGITREILMNSRPPLLIYGTLTNQKNKAPLNTARVKSEIRSNKQVIGTVETNASGDYRIELEEVTDYNLVMKKDGFISIYPVVKLASTQKFQEIRLDTSLIPIEIGTTVRLNNIQFEYNKATLLPESFEELDHLVSLMEDASKLVVEIQGHTDSDGGDAYNLELSNKRAASVREYLLSKGIPSDRIESKGYGKTKPLVKNDSPKNKAINRRVQFVVLKID